MEGILVTPEEAVSRSEVEALRAQLKEVAGIVNGLYKAIQGHRDETSADVKAEMGQVEDKLSQLSARFDHFAGQFDVHRQQLETHAGVVKNVNTTAANFLVVISKRMDGIDQRLSNLENGLSQRSPIERPDDAALSAGQPMPGWNPSINFDPAGTDGRRDLGAREVGLAKVIGDTLFQAYPGYMWAVHVDLHNKYKAATIQLPVIMPASKKYVIPVRYLGTLADMNRAVLRAGGEILERYKIPRSSIKFGEAQFLEARGKALRVGNRAEIPV